MKAKTWVVVTLLSLCAVLLLQNMEVVTLKVLFWDITMSRVIAFPLLVIIGIIIGYTVAKLTGRTQRDKKKSWM